MRTIIKQTKQGVRVFIPDSVNVDKAVRRVEKKLGSELRHLGNAGEAIIFAPAWDQAFAIKCQRDQRRFGNLRGPAPFMRKIQSRAMKVLNRWCAEIKVWPSIQGGNRPGWVQELCKARSVPKVVLNYAFGAGSIKHRW